MSPWLRFRTVLDRVLAALLLVLAGPVIAVLAWHIRRHDPGPGLIALPRIGREGRPFRMWKLRTMRAVMSSGEAGGAPIARGEDDRVTTVGRRLRAWRVDELPQLCNIIRGEMALIGPRPETPEYVDTNRPDWQAVLAAKPGIVGPTQLLVADWETLVMRDETPPTEYESVILPVKLAIDAWYVRAASPALDLAVCGDLLRRLTGNPSAAHIRRRLRAGAPVVADALDSSQATVEACRDLGGEHG